MRPHLASLVADFRQHASETAVVAHRGNRSHRTTYGELAQLAGRFAAELDRRAVSPGDRVIVWGENSTEWIAVFFGCLLRGVIAVPLDAAGSPDFATRVTNDVSPKLIASDRNLLHILSTATPQLFFSELNEQLPTEPNFIVSEAVTEQTPFQIIFTSGTTSEPKGIVHTHRNVLSSLQPIENEIAKYLRYERWVHPLRFLHTLPLSHVFGQFMGLWTPPLLAAELHFTQQLEPARMTDLIRRERISVLIAVPRILQLLRTYVLTKFDSLAAELEQAKEFPAWKRWWRFRRVHRTLGLKFWAVISGGASLPPELETFWNRLGFALIQGYGMTETAALVTLNHPFRIGHGTIGKALPGREVRISDDGEILVRGDMLATSTWRSGAMHPRESEWLATGDLATENESGELRFLGRKGDVIVTAAGMNVHPADLEEAMRKQPGVHSCAVVPCEMQSGTEPIAVVLFSGDDEQLHAAAAQANRELAAYQQIRRVLRWPDLQLPYTSTGKLLRRKVAQWACATILNQQAGISTAPTQDDLIQMIAEVTDEQIPDNDDHQRLSEDLHLDSLGRVQLQSILEQRLGLELDDDAIASAQTLGDLREMLELQTGTSHLAQGDDAPAPHPAITAVEDHTATSPPDEAYPLCPHIHTAKDSETSNQSDHIYPHWPWSWPFHAIHVAFIELIMRPLVWILAAPRVTRQTTELPSGPILIIANHVTAYDGALILYALPAKLRRNVAVAMSGEILLDLRHGRNQGNPLLNLLAPAAYWLVTALFNVFPLPRQRGFRRSFAHAGEAMDRGYSVMIFPEGTRSRDGKLGHFRPGIGLLANESTVPILPVALIGLGELKATKARWLRSGKLEVRVGKPIPWDESAAPAELTAKLEESVRQLHSPQNLR